MLCHGGRVGTGAIDDVGDIFERYLTNLVLYKQSNLIKSAKTSLKSRIETLWITIG